MKDLSLHILDIVQNSLVADSTEVYIGCTQDATNETLSLAIQDNGKGMCTETLQKVTDPFFTTRTTRKVGMGIPLLKQNAEATGGSFKIESCKGEGTKLEATFGLNHVDRPPLGDLPGVVVLIAGANPAIRFKYVHSVGEKCYVFDTLEVSKVLDGLPINNAEVLRFLKEMITENLLEIKAF